MKTKKSSLEKRVDKMVCDFCSNLDKEISTVLTVKKRRAREKYPFMAYVFYCMYERNKNDTP